jgi:hypothetical protein
MGLDASGKWDMQQDGGGWDMQQDGGGWGSSRIGSARMWSDRMEGRGER